jgi:hypothetical protein
MKSAFITAFFGAMMLIAGTSEAQTRLRGTVTAAAGNAIAVKTADAKTVDLIVDDKTIYIFAQPIQMSDIKPGDFLGVTSVKRPDGTLMAYDVRRFPKPTNPGHRPFDGGDNQTMTNATVSATVDAAQGRELVLTYDGSSEKVVVADTAAITSLVPGQRSQVVGGSYVNVLTEPGAEGKLVARTIEVRKEAPKPLQ